MEQETKYTIPNKELANTIWTRAKNGDFGPIIEPEEVVMKAVYFDTEDGILRKNNIALRSRSEGNACFATLKWGSTHSEIDGLHQHQELNVPADMDTCFISFPADIFDQSIDGQKMHELLGGKALENQFETRILRRRAQINRNGSIVELSIDEGSVDAGENTCPISEIEIELFNGSLDEVLNLTKEIADEYNLSPEGKSKYAKGLALLGKKKGE